LSYTLDATAPAVIVTAPAPGLPGRTNITVVGRTSDNLSGVAALVAQVDSGPTIAVTFDASGGYRFATTLPGDGTADGVHTVHLQATDRAGNVSQPFDFSFTLDTRTAAQACDFSGGLAGWAVDQRGGTATGQGSVTTAGTDAVLL